jgi:hypothetical protein
MALDAGATPVPLIRTQPAPRHKAVKMSSFTAEERQFIKVLSRRRRLEVLEPLLAENFRDLTVFERRRTNIVSVLIAKYEELTEVGPMFFYGKDGGEELYELFVWLRDLADQVVQRHSAAEWLLLVRRCFLSPFDAETLPPRWFIEPFLRRSRTTEPRSRLDGRVLRGTPQLFEDLHDLLLVTTAMWNVGRAFRTLSKGLVVTLGNATLFVGGAIPTNATVASAIGLYEARMTLWPVSGLGRPLPSVGVQGRRFAPDGAESQPGGAIGAWFELDLLHDEGRYFTRRRTHYFPEFIDPNSVFGLGTSQQPSLRAVAAAGALWAAWDNIGVRGFERRSPVGDWNLWGVRAMRLDTLRQALRAWSPIATRYVDGWSEEDALEALTRAGDRQSWIDSACALVLPFGSECVLIDLEGACRALGEAHERPTGGAEANQWTRLFEAQIQRVIDRSDWRPEGPHRALIRKTVYLNGQTLTDLDAVGFRDGELLLIDAKSWITPRDLEFGEYWAVNDRVKKVEQAAKDWDARVAAIRQHPEILNIDPPFEIQGLVVTPEVPYVLPGACTQELTSGMLAVSTIAELDRCLNPDTYWDDARAARSDR